MMTRTERDDRETVGPGVADPGAVLVNGETPVSLPDSVEAAAEQFEATTRTIGFEVPPATGSNRRGPASR